MEQGISDPFFRAAVGKQVRLMDAVDIVQRADDPFTPAVFDSRLGGFTGNGYVTAVSDERVVIAGIVEADLLVDGGAAAEPGQGQATCKNDCRAEQGRDVHVQVPRRIEDLWPYRFKPIWSGRACSG